MVVVAGNRVEAYRRMTLRDFFAKVNNVPFSKAKKILEANADPKESLLELADKECQSLREGSEESGGDEDGWWSAVSVKYHKTCATFNLWILLSPVESTLLYAYEGVRNTT